MLLKAYDKRLGLQKYQSYVKGKRKINEQKKQNERDRKMGNGIMVYALETCGECNKLIDGLDRNGIKYQYINISKNDALGDKLEEVYKCTSYPMVLNNNVMFLPYTSLSITSNIKIYNSIAELINYLTNKIK